MSSTVLSRGLLLRVLVGATVFVALQAALLSFSPSGPTRPPEEPNWFLNSIQGVLIVSAAFLALGGLSVMLDPVDIAVAATPLTVGGAVGVIATYAWLGGGNLFPIVVLMGTGWIGVATFAGAWVVFEARRSIAR